MPPRRTLGEKVRARFNDDPAKELPAMGARQGAVVLDVGAGRGFYTLVAARIVRPGGRVFAAEPDPEKAERLRRRVEEEGLDNVTVIRSGAEALGEVEPESVDAAFAVRSLHHFADKTAGLREVRRTLKPGGTFYIRDFLWNRWKGHGIRREEIRLLSEAGYSKAELLDTRKTLRARLTK